ncbi:X2-like carbohydrate binding domain-containing protein [Butyrivibrio sp. NC2007]|uniref:X2-like carbohydrate binding domain-containing protein n=1 Tax=Butyrivibrio sp. NC2007 TaxID=1280683 RepID=UPI0003B5E49F|nr:X2-like carbohydrate binding domain-containing protein [Butyrivibrio sp. NC2007]
MTKGNFKRFAALLVAGTMVVGSSVTAFAEGETTTPGVAEGEGSYEGGEMKYPTLSVTLPTIPDGAYNYIADPNGLIAATAAAAYDGATFTGSQGVFFKTTDAEGETKATYTNKSKALTLKNENAQDIDVTIKLEQKTAGSDTIEYSDSATFEDGDKAQKLYLAVTDDAASNAQVSALGETAATLTTTVAGKTGNYKANWDSTNKYGYILDDTKKVDGEYVWESCSYTLVGALNKAATWGDEVDFPTIKVTWSYKEHTDSYLSSTTISSSSNTVTVSLPSGVTVSSVVLGKATGGTVTLVAGSHYTVSGSTYTFDASMLENHSTGSVTFTFSDETSETMTIE